MAFYVLRVLLPALLIDVALTISFLRKGRRALGAFIASPLYLITALVWIVIFSGDLRFQGQGVIGLAVFLCLGVGFTLLRLLLGLIIFFDQSTLPQKFLLAIGPPPYSLIPDWYQDDQVRPKEKYLKQFREKH
jgi:hypothetical protein